MDLQQLVHDRRVQVGAVVAGAGVGAVVLIRKRMAGTTGSSAGSSTNTGAQPYVQSGFPDTTGTDLASWLGSYTGNIDQELQQLQAGQAGLATAIGNLGGSEGKPPGGVTHPPPGPPVGNPVAHPPAPGTPTTVTVTRWTAQNTQWSSTLSGIAGHYHMTVPQLLKLNPSIKNANLIRTGQQIRIR